MTMASDKIDLSLDDIIKITKKSGGNNRRGGNRGGRNSTDGGRQQNSTGGGVTQRKGQRGRGRGGGRQSFGSGRSSTAPNGRWDHDMYNKSGQGRMNGNAAGSRGGGAGNLGKLIVKNLDFGVSDSDINELFSEFGPLRKSAIHYDRTGRSLGTADVHFERRSDAQKAMNQYNGVPLDGRVMNISFANGAPLMNNGGSGNISSRLGNKVGGGGDRNRGNNNRRSGGRGGGNRRGGGRGGRQPKEEISAEDLDKQLDEYITKMQE